MFSQRESGTRGRIWLKEKRIYSLNDDPGLVVLPQYIIWQHRNFHLLNNRAELHNLNDNINSSKSLIINAISSKAT